MPYILSMLGGMRAGFVARARLELALQNLQQFPRSRSR